MDTKDNKKAKIWISFLCLAIIILVVGQTAKTIWLRHKYPTAVLTSDYGILDQDDFLFTTVYNDHWICSEIKNVCFECRDLEDEGNTELNIDVNCYGNFDSFTGRHAIEMESCQRRLDEWTKLTTGEKYVCVAGQDPSDYVKKIPGHAALKGRVWMFSKFKTKKGCSSWFDGDCVRNNWVNEVAK